MLNSTKISLTSFMMIGVIMTICSNNWMSMWMGLEMSLLSFIPMLQNTKNNKSSESMIGYFIMQSVASMIFMLSVIIMLIGVNMMNEMLLMISMLIKLGSAPFHNWVLMIIEPMDWFSMFTMLTILKTPPMFIISQIKPKMLIIPIILSMIMSSILCLNQSSLRKIIAYSSIFNVAMMLMININLNLTYLYLTIYSTMILLLILTLKTIKANFINQLSLMEFNMWIKLNLWINMLSLSGFPPLMGFSIKFMVMQSLINNNQMIILMILIITSMLTMMFYTRLAFTSMLCSFSMKKWNKSIKNKSMHNFMLMNLTLTMFMITVTSVY